MLSQTCAWSHIVHCVCSFIRSSFPAESAMKRLTGDSQFCWDVLSLAGHCGSGAAGCCGVRRQYLRAAPRWENFTSKKVPGLVSPSVPSLWQQLTVWFCPQPSTGQGSLPPAATSSRALRRRSARPGRRHLRSAAELPLAAAAVRRRSSALLSAAVPPLASLGVLSGSRWVSRRFPPDVRCFGAVGLLRFCAALYYSQLAHPASLWTRLYSSCSTTRAVPELRVSLRSANSKVAFGTRIENVKPVRKWQRESFRVGMCVFGRTKGWKRLQRFCQASEEKNVSITISHVRRSCRKLLWRWQPGAYPFVSEGLCSSAGLLCAGPAEDRGSSQSPAVILTSASSSEGPAQFCPVHTTIVSWGLGWWAGCWDLGSTRVSLCLSRTC